MGAVGSVAIRIAPITQRPAFITTLCRSTAMMVSQSHQNSLGKGTIMKPMMLAASLAAALLSGCAALADSDASAGATSQTQTASSASQRSGAPADADAGIF